jgi:hypothetical protein
MDAEIITTPPRSQKPAHVKAKVVELRTLGVAESQIAKQLSISPSTVKTILSEARYGESTKLSVEQTLAKVGITHETISRKLLELTNAADVRLASFEGKFTDRLDVPDGAIQFRSAEALAKIAGMFPREDAAIVAQLFVRLPEGELIKGHTAQCTCPECCERWQSLPIAPVIEP